MSSWTDEEIQKVWDKAEKVSKENEEIGFRKDQCGAWIEVLMGSETQNMVGKLIIRNQSQKAGKIF